MVLARIETEHNAMVMVLQFPPDMDVKEVAGARVLMLDHTGNIHSIYREETVATGGLYWDYLAILPSLVPGTAPVAILGLGAGTVPRIIAQTAPQARMVGWELDAGVVEVSRHLLGLAELELERKLEVRVGDALGADVGQAGPFSGIVVDLFAEGKLLPQLKEVATWQQLRQWLVAGGRVIANIGAVGQEFDGSGEAAIAAMAAAFDGEVLVRDLVTSTTTNCVAMSGPLPPDLATAVPELLRECGTNWRQHRSDNESSSTPAKQSFGFQDQDD